MFCGNCGKEVGGADQFCGSCGSKTVQPVPAQSQQQAQLAYQPPLEQYAPPTPPGYVHQQHGASAHPVYQLRANSQLGYVLKEKRTALQLCLFLGWFGVHRFYVGKIQMGMYMFGLGAIPTMFFIFAILFADVFFIYLAGGIAIPIFIWWLIDLILICKDKFTDQDGRPLRKR